MVLAGFSFNLWHSHCKTSLLFLAFSFLIACIYLLWPTGNDPSVGSSWCCSSLCFNAEYAACVTDASSSGLWVNFSHVTLRPSVLHLSGSPAVRPAFVFHPQVQFQKIQQLRLSQTRAPYYGGSLPNVNQIGNTSTEFQVGARHRPPHTASS